MIPISLYKSLMKNRLWKPSLQSHQWRVQFQVWWKLFSIAFLKINLPYIGQEPRQYYSTAWLPLQGLCLWAVPLEMIYKTFLLICASMVCPTLATQSKLWPFFCTVYALNKAVNDSSLLSLTNRVLTVESMFSNYKKQACYWSSTCNTLQCSSDLLRAGFKSLTRRALMKWGTSIDLWC